MPRQDIDLFACWRGLFGSTQSATVWKMVSYCLLWCLWRGKNDRSFEDRKSMLVELNSLVFNTLYYWTDAFVFSNLLIFL
jgi:hypothetical protein